MNKWAGRLGNRGFTIVELLIVIVVIAILATISILSFNGITGRAENAKTITAVRQALTALEVMHVEVGAYPISASDSIADRFPCLGEYDNDICASITGVAAAGVGPAYVSSQLNTYLREFGSIAQPSTREVNLEGHPVVGAFFVLPTPTDPDAGNKFSIGWVLQDTTDCGIAGSFLTFQDGAGVLCYRDVVSLN